MLLTCCVPILIFYSRYLRKKRSLWKVPGRTEQWWLNLDGSVSPPEV